MTLTEFTNKYHLTLNTQQLAAVSAVDKPVLLLAVPGSGKTTVLVSRIGYIINCLGAAPESILAVTYTRAAAADMKQRYCSIFGDESGGKVEFCTINGLCARILNYYSRTVKPNPYTLLTDAGTLKALLLDIYKHYCKDYPTDGDIQDLMTQIAYCKNMMLNNDEIKKLDKPGHPFSKMYDAYDKWMRDNGKMDYDDQMKFARIIMGKYPDILRHYQKQYRFICVDEAQDTSKIQHTIINMLAGGGSNLFMVGDEDQSIYGFRAAYPEALINFESNYPGGTVLLLEENYRSNAKIVEAADKFISSNVSRHAKTMRAARPAGADLREIPLASREEQYSHLLNAAKTGKRQTAVLYRENESALPLIDLLEREHIPYNVRANDTNFFTGRIVRDVTDISALAEDPCNTDAFMRIYYKLKLFINKQTAEQACSLCHRGDMDIPQALIFLNSNDRNKQKFEQFSTNLTLLKTDTGDKAISRISYEMNYKDYLIDKDLPDGSLDTLKAIGKNEPSLRALLSRLETLRGIIVNKKNIGDCRFILSTIHSAKGLEYDVVYLLDIYDGVLPSDAADKAAQKDSDAFRNYEEERRLFYVAMTRAKNDLSIFSIRFRRSMFLDEVFGREKPVLKSAPSSLTPASASKSFDYKAYYAFLKELSVGTKVSHPKFGRGTITDVNDDILTIAFDDVGTKKIGAQFAFTNSGFKVFTNDSESHA